ncbi:restart primosome assembly protein PriC [Kosakonia oryzendophytica]|uniref:Restart primosome assembly protein PriC n=1 Tax=Kosakonia oryzendophytica TaxID=1005665 RepID=A0A1C4ALI9_9ENTR|nr:primosomal replication protein N'' [Kosakonia oryzendophytica]AMO50218.1 Primosomal replication protein N [Enterobacter sp. FY-07]TDT60648.1 restart primosome assembly protein PriC [Enterobacter sp. AG5470]WBT57203.1 primosomal replication protein N'' [Kosakonia oryzendophytica]SCB95366.1 restart primosome assembly protein PriC [Kosakonia oryzendophytica]
MKSAALLQRLEQQLAVLRQQAAPLAQHATVSPRFDRHLFRTRSTHMQAYVDEIADNMQALRHAADNNSLAQVVWLAEHLTAQIAALTRESAVWSLREWDHASPAVARWQRKRLQHQDYERRLLEMQQQREQRLSQATTLAEQQQLHNEVAALAARLARCRSALDNIERVLAQITR